jgi:hypothetical protein
MFPDISLVGVMGCRLCTNRLNGHPANRIDRALRRNPAHIAIAGLIV